MKVEIEAEKAGGAAATAIMAPVIVVAGGAEEESDAGDESDGGASDASDEFIAEEIVDHIGMNKARKYIVRWQGCGNDTSEEPAQRFGTALPLELLETYLMTNPAAERGNPGNVVAVNNLHK